MIEKRRHLREKYVAGLEYSLTPFSENETHFGITIDISDSGMRIYSFNALKESQRIIFRKPLHLEYQEATVRWVDKNFGEFCRAGLMFLVDERVPEREDDPLSLKELLNTSCVAAR